MERTVRQSPKSPTDLVLSSMSKPPEETKADAKKRRHRENMARGRTRHNALMDSMRKQYDHLNKNLEGGMDVWRRRLPTTSSSSGSDEAGYTSESSTSTMEKSHRLKLTNRYIDAVAIENAIHRENEALAQRLEQMAIFETMLRVDTPELQPHKLDSELPAKTVQALNRPGFWSYFAEDTEPFYYEPMPPSTVYQIVRDKYQIMKVLHARFMNDQKKNDSMQFFGWTVQRCMSDKQKFEFHFTKLIPCTDSVLLAEELAIDGWRVFNNPDMYRRCYRSPIDVRVLQRVDAFNTVLIRNSPDANRSHRYRHLNISSKVVDEDAYGHKSLSILTIVVPPPNDLANSNRNGVVYLRDAYTYMRFDMFEDHVQFSYGGHADCLNEAQARYLFVETGNVLFRFEQMIRRSNLVTLG